MTLKEDFDKAAENVKNLKQKPTDEELLQIYGLFKQATVGDNNTPSPGMFALKDKAKWGAWNALKGMSKEEAMQAYVDKAKTMVEIYGL